jgi:hypothetical protein
VLFEQPAQSRSTRKAAGADSQSVVVAPALFAGCAQDRPGHYRGPCPRDCVMGVGQAAFEREIHTLPGLARGLLEHRSGAFRRPLARRRVMRVGPRKNRVDGQRLAPSGPVLVEQATQARPARQTSVSMPEQSIDAPPVLAQRTRHWTRTAAGPAPVRLEMRVGPGQDLLDCQRRPALAGCRRSSVLEPPAHRHDLLEQRMLYAGLDSPPSQGPGGGRRTVSSSSCRKGGRGLRSGAPGRRLTISRRVRLQADPRSARASSRWRRNRRRPTPGPGRE